MNIAVVTMVYNESFNLPLWARHYAAQCPGSELFVIDHGSDVNVRDVLDDVNVVRLPRSDFDERRRVDVVNRLASALLLEFDWVLYTDCDELIVAKGHETLSESLADEPEGVRSVTAVGLNLWHLTKAEAGYRPDRPLGEQRRYATFEKFMCKPFAARVPISWIPGFHTSDLPPDFGLGYYQIHTKYIDFEETKRRLRLTSGLNWSTEALEKNWSSHQRIDEERMTRKFHGLEALVDDNKLSAFDFEDECARFVAGSVKDGSGNWRCDAALPGRVVEVPRDVLAKLP